MRVLLRKDRERFHKYRYEFKYLLPEGQEEAFRRELSRFMVPDPMVANEPSGTYRVSSLYLDTPDFNYYHEKIAGTRSRVKPRIRWYGRGLSVASEQDVFLELKLKRDMMARKKRVKVDGATANLILRREYPFNALNDPDAAYRENLEEFLYLQHCLQLVPIVIVSYDRQPFVDSYVPVRATIDSHLRGYDTGQLGIEDVEGRHFLPGRSIFELKFTGSAPPWFQLLIQKYGLEREPISKYVHAVQACRIQTPEYWGGYHNPSFVDRSSHPVFTRGVERTTRWLEHLRRAFAV